ncbi:MAG: family 10 glycosylhydrolase [Gemmataceae bacterium]|nr:family 10 glycosylhydrolase [Gemmataceae bacterium]
MCRVIFALLLVGWAASPARADEPARQWRAFWVDGFNPGIKTPEQAAKLIADLKSLNGNTLIVQVRKRGDALFRKSVEPFAEDATIPEGFDPLGHLLKLAKEQGVQVHAWVNVSTIWPGKGDAPKSPDHVFNKHGLNATGRANWLSMDDSGNPKFGSGHFVDAGHPDYAQHFVRVVRELVKEYPVDGIHFDYVRYSETEGSLEAGYGAGYNPTNVARFNRVHGRTGNPDRGDPAWQDWRRAQITAIVRRVRVALLEDKPEVMLSGALIPWGGGPADEAGWYRTAPYNRVFQDWHAWRKEGLLDLIVPMNYDRDANPAHKTYFDQWIRFEKMFRDRTLSVVGVGAYMNTDADTASQITRALAPSDQFPGADGISIYNYAFFNRERDGKRGMDGLREKLVSAPNAPFAKPAQLPVVPRLAKPIEGVIAGRATGADGQPLDTVTIPVAPVGGGAPVYAVTDGNGHFAAFQLKPGRYRLAVPVQGVAKPVAVEVAAGRVTRVGQ